jgi:hypothetical protein
MSEENACRVRAVSAPDGREIPIPAGGVGIGRETINISDSAQVQITPGPGSYYVVVNNAEPSNNEAQDLFAELATEGAVTALEHLAQQAFTQVAPCAIKLIGFSAGILVSVFTSSKLTREIFIRNTLDDGTNITYCLLV